MYFFSRGLEFHWFGKLCILKSSMQQRDLQKLVGVSPFDDRYLYPLSIIATSRWLPRYCNLTFSVVVFVLSPPLLSDHIQQGGTFKLQFYRDSGWRSSSFILDGVYIPSQACVSEALQHLAEQITNMEHKHSASLLIVLWDFNSANLSKDLPKYRQHIKCSTRDKNTMDQYTVLKDTYRLVPCLYFLSWWRKYNLCWAFLLMVLMLKAHIRSGEIVVPRNLKVSTAEAVPQELLILFYSIIQSVLCHWFGYATKQDRD